jgi:hypothetical protein
MRRRRDGGDEGQHAPKFTSPTYPTSLTLREPLSSLAKGGRGHQGKLSLINISILIRS